MPLAIDHVHAPSFEVTVSLIDDRKLHYAASRFSVERALRVRLETPEQPLEPGAEQEISITVTDQQDQPVQAELSLSLVNEALLRLFPDRRTEVQKFFQADQRRLVQHRTVTSVDFKYKGATREVLKTVEEEAERLVRVEREQRRLGEIQLSGYGYAPLVNAPAAVPTIAPGNQQALQLQRQQLAQINNSRDFRAQQPNAAPQQGGAQQQEKSAPPAREDGMDSARWLAAIETDKEGRATLQLDLPDLPSSWVLHALGVTPETLVGEVSSNVVARKKFFVELKDPALLQEGDAFTWIARVYSDAPVDKGPVSVTLKLSGAGKDFSSTKQIRLNEQGFGEVLLDSWTVPAGEEITAEVSAVQGARKDRWTGRFPIRPWGQEFPRSRWWTDS